MLHLAPLGDVEGFAKRLEAMTPGKVESVAGRTIRMRVDYTKLPTAPPIPPDADPITQALFALKSLNTEWTLDAFKFLKRSIPHQRQTEVARALGEFLEHYSTGYIDQAAEVLIIWGTPEQVPALEAVMAAGPDA